MGREAVKYGSITILSGLGATLVSTLLIWLFSQTIDIKPLTKAVETNTQLVKDIAKKHSEEKAEVLKLIYEQNRIMAVEQERLSRVKQDCDFNTKNIISCKTNH